MTIQAHWQCQTVQEFFSQSYWQGQPLAKSISPARPASPLTLTVGEFFELASWEGNLKIAAFPSLTSIPEPTSPSPALKLSDLSDLF